MLEFFGDKVIEDLRVGLERNVDVNTLREFKLII